jgi:hypothetical protein
MEAVGCFVGCYLSPSLKLQNFVHRLPVAGDQLSFGGCAFSFAGVATGSSRCRVGTAHRHLQACRSMPACEVYM